MIDKMVSNGVSYFGWNARKRILEEIKGKGFKKVLLVISQEVNDGVLGNNLSIFLDDNDILFDSLVYKDEDYKSFVKKGTRLLNKHHSDVILVIGDDKIIDSAKMMGIIFNNDEFKNIDNINGKIAFKNSSLPVIMLPTVIGARFGSGLTLIDDLVFNYDDAMPYVSIFDYELIGSMQSSRLLYSLLASLVNSCESYLNSSFLIDSFNSKKSIELLYNNLEKALNKEKDGLENATIGDYLSYISFNKNNIGFVIAKNISSFYDLDVNLVEAILLPYLFIYYKDNDKLRDICDVCGYKTGQIILSEVYERLTINFRELLNRLNIPKNLKNCRKNDDEFDIILSSILEDTCLKDVEVSYDGVLKILKQIL